MYNDGSRKKRVNLLIDRVVDEDSQCSGYDCTMSDYGGCPTTSYYGMGSCYGPPPPPPCVYPPCGPAPCAAPAVQPPSACPAAMCPTCAQIAARVLSGTAHSSRCPLDLLTPCPSSICCHHGCRRRGECVRCSLPSKNEDSALYKCCPPYFCRQGNDKCDLQALNRMLDEKIDKVLKPVLLTMAKTMLKPEKKNKAPCYSYSRPCLPNFMSPCYGAPSYCLPSYSAPCGRRTRIQCPSTSSESTSSEECVPIRKKKQRPQYYCKSENVKCKRPPSSIKKKQNSDNESSNDEADDDKWLMMPKIKDKKAMHDLAPQKKSANDQPKKVNSNEKSSPKKRVAHKDDNAVFDGNKRLPYPPP